MKKGFISIFTLLILLVLSLAISFIYTQNINTSEFTADLYNKKKAQYMAESMINIYMEENSDQLAELILDDYNDPKKDFNKNKIIKAPRYVDYAGRRQIVSVTYVSRANNKGDIGIGDLHGLYQIFLKGGVDVDGSHADSELYIKVLDTDNESRINDKGRLKIVINRTF